MLGEARSVMVAYEAAKSSWDHFEVSVEAFTAHVERLGLDEERLALRAPDIFLVVGVMDQMPAALQRLDALVTEAARVTTRIDRSPDFQDEVRQQLRIKLLAGNGRRLTAYSGTGALVDWLRVSAWRIGLGMRRAEARAMAQRLTFGALQEDESDDALKRFYAQDFSQAIESSFQALTTRERTILRFHLVEGFNVDRIATVYGIHRATAARWLVAIRQKLFVHAKAALAEKHGLDTRDVKSLYHLLQNDVDLTISRLLAG